MSSDNLSDRIKKIGKSFPGGLRAWARTAKVPESTLFGYSSSVRHPSLRAAGRLAKAAGVSLDWLATGEEYTCRTVNEGISTVQSEKEAVDTERMEDAIEVVVCYCREMKITPSEKKLAHAIALAYQIFSRWEEKSDDPHVSMRANLREGIKKISPDMLRLMRGLLD